uniref:Uncharacterized protein n=1 Tax=Anguilla anguilla TaxID=7936 RepID=A0A0E9X0E4_ANGAN
MMNDGKTTKQEAQRARLLREISPLLGVVRGAAGILLSLFQWGQGSGVRGRACCPGQRVGNGCRGQSHSPATGVPQRNAGYVHTYTGFICFFWEEGAWEAVST